MKLQDKLVDALNVQIKEELASAYLYFAMAADFEYKNRPGIAGWLKSQASEEVNHALRIYEYINDRGGKAVLQALDAPKASWDSPVAAFRAALKHEQFITGCIDKLVKLSRDADDTATEVFLQWFVNEQVEEEKTTGQVVEMFEEVGDSKEALFMIDRELGQRKEG
jgi:ferritin